MTGRIAASCALATLLLATPVAAQDDAARDTRQVADDTFGDPASLDEFAVPQSRGPTRTLAVPQLSQSEGARQPEPRVRDSSLDVPGPGSTDDAPIAQLAQPGRDGRAPEAQVAPSAGREVVQENLAADGDSVPVAIVLIEGEDRCDPGQSPEQLARCESILERRAAEFAAAEAPRLSAEQVLLAGQGEDERMRASSSTTLRLRLADQSDPDAEASTNQELASIYLGRDTARPPVEQTPEGDPGAADLPAALVEVLQGLNVPVAPAP